MIFVCLAKRRLNSTSKVNTRTDRRTYGQTDTQTDTQTNISTYRKHWPRGLMLIKLWQYSLLDKVYLLVSFHSCHTLQNGVLKIRMDSELRDLCSEVPSHKIWITKPPGPLWLMAWSVCVALHNCFKDFFLLWTLRHIDWITLGAKSSEMHNKGGR